MAIWGGGGLGCGGLVGRIGGGEVGGSGDRQAGDGKLVTEAWAHLLLKQVYVGSPLPRTTVRSKLGEAMVEMEGGETDAGRGPAICVEERVARQMLGEASDLCGEVAVGGLGGRRSRGYSTLAVDGQPGAVDGRLGGELRAAEVRGGEGQPDGCQGSWGSPSEKARLGPMEGVEPVADDNEKPRLLSSNEGREPCGTRLLGSNLCSPVPQRSAAGQRSVPGPECPLEMALTGCKG